MKSIKAKKIVDILNDFKDELSEAIAEVITTAVELAEAELEKTIRKEMRERAIGAFCDSCDGYGSMCLACDKQSNFIAELDNDKPTKT